VLSIVRVRPLVWFRALFVHGGVCDVMMTTYCLPIHTHKMVDVHTKGGGPVSAPRHRSRPRGRGRGRYRYRYRYRSIDRSIDRSRAWVRAWVSHGFRMGFACPNDVHPPIDVTRVGTARRIGAMSGAPSTSSAAMQAKLVRGR